MSLGKFRNRFELVGGGLLKSAVLANGGSLVAMDDLGYLDEAGTEWNVDPQMVIIKDERNLVINALSAGEDWRIKSTLLQVSKAEYDLICNGWDEFRHFFYQVKLKNGNVQELYIPLGKIISPLNVKFAAGQKRNIPIEIVALMGKHTSQVVVTPTAFNVPVGAYGVLAENATAQGEVTTSSGTLYSAFV